MTTVVHLPIHDLRRPLMLPSRPSTETISAQMLNQVMGWTRRLLRPPLDHESAAMDVVVRCLEHGIKPTWTMTRNHCYDLLRRHRLEKDAEKLRANSTIIYIASPDDLVDPDPLVRSSDTDLLQELGRRARLTRSNLMLVYLRVYVGLGWKEIEQRTGVPSGICLREWKGVLERLVEARRSLT